MDQDVNAVRQEAEAVALANGLTFTAYLLQLAIGSLGHDRLHAVSIVDRAGGACNQIFDGVLRSGCADTGVSRGDPCMNFVARVPGEAGAVRV